MIISIILAKFTNPTPSPKNCHPWISNGNHRRTEQTAILDLVKIGLNRPRIEQINQNVLKYHLKSSQICPIDPILSQNVHTCWQWPRARLPKIQCHYIQRWGNYVLFEPIKSWIDIFITFNMRYIARRRVTRFIVTATQAGLPQTTWDGMSNLSFKSGQIGPQMGQIWDFLR